MWVHLHKHLIVSSALVYFVLPLIVPPKDEEEVVEEMETSTSLEEDSIPVISRSVSYEIYFWYYTYAYTAYFSWSLINKLRSTKMNLRTLNFSFGVQDSKTWLILTSQNLKCLSFKEWESREFSVAVHWILYQNHK